jgi:hypothetical protein
MATILNTNLVYDPRYHTFESWASLMCEQYAAQQLCIPDASTNWQDWASALKAIDVFANEGIPGPFIFNDWQEWAEALVNSVNPSVN